MKKNQNQEAASELGIESPKRLPRMNLRSHLEQSFKNHPPKTLSGTIQRLVQCEIRPTPGTRALARVSQPFDLLLLELSSLFRKSRTLFLKSSGRFYPTLNSSPRTLSSDVLLENQIEYTPIEEELTWAALDPIQRKNENHLEFLRSLITNLFHEQNHRLLWQFLPNAPQSPGGVRRYLNFAESLVVCLDLALSDELRQPLSSALHLVGVIYDRGAAARELRILKSLSRREYRNYLHACVLATYLLLEGYDPSWIETVVAQRFDTTQPLGRWAAQRSLLLDSKFVKQTNPFWQRRHWKTVSQKLQMHTGDSLEIHANPAQAVEIYLWAEKWLAKMGL